MFTKLLFRFLDPQLNFSIAIYLLGLVFFAGLLRIFFVLGKPQKVIALPILWGLLGIFEASSMSKGVATNLQLNLIFPLVILSSIFLSLWYLFELGIEIRRIVKAENDLTVSPFLLELQPKIDALCEEYKVEELISNYQILGAGTAAVSIIFSILGGVINGGKMSGFTSWAIGGALFSGVVIILLVLVTRWTKHVTETSSLEGEVVSRLQALSNRCLELSLIVNEIEKVSVEKFQFITPETSRKFARCKKAVDAINSHFTSVGSVLANQSDVAIQAAKELLDEGLHIKDCLVNELATTALQPFTVEPGKWDEAMHELKSELLTCRTEIEKH